MMCNARIPVAELLSIYGLFVNQPIDRPFDIAIFCVPESSRAAAATSIVTAAHHEQHPEWQLRQANIFACLPQNSATTRSHPTENAFDADALANGVAAGKSRVLVCLLSSGTSICARASIEIRCYVILLAAGSCAHFRRIASHRRRQSLCAASGCDCATVIYLHCDDLLPINAVSQEQVFIFFAPARCI